MINDSPEAYLIIDDSVQDKRHSKIIKRVKRQYSGNVHDLVKDIGIINLVDTDQMDYYLIDFRIYAPTADGKTKNDHFRQMIVCAYADKEIKAPTILFDCGYASSDNIKLIHKLGKYFVTTWKENRLIGRSQKQGYIHLPQILWTDVQFQSGIPVKLTEVPFKVQLFKIVTTNGGMDWVMTNRPQGSINTQVAQKENKMRWAIERLHRELKPLTGIEKCQCRKQRAQRNHLACCYQAWFSLKVRAKKLGTMLYKVKPKLWDHYLRNVLRQP